MKAHQAYQVRRSPSRPLVRALLVLVGLSPLIVAAAHSMGLKGAWLAPFESWFRLQCHADPERSFWLADAPLSVCSRCLGIYLGLAVAALVARPRLDARLVWAWVTVAVLLLVADVLSEAAALRPAFAPLRFVLGFGLAYPVALALAGVARGDEENAARATKEKSPRARGSSGSSFF